MNYYHICTEGINDNVIFRDNDDYIAAMNHVAITSIEQKITLLAFCLMSNHLHFIVWSDYMMAKKFIISVKRRYSLRHWHKYKEPGIFAGSRQPICIKEITDMDYLKSAIAYVLRNPFNSFGELIWNYPWSSLNAYFNGSFTGMVETQLKGNSRRKNAKILHSTYKVTDIPISINHAGFIPQKEYINYKKVESLFVTPKSMSYFLNKDRDKEMEIELTSLSKKITTNDNAILKVLPDILMENFGVDSIDSIDLKQQYTLIGILHKRFNSSAKQIGRILRLDPDVLK